MKRVGCARWVLHKNFTRPFTKTMRESQRRYYEINRSAIIRSKTLQMIETIGRIPKNSTVEKHGLDSEAVERAFNTYMQRCPDTKAARRIRTLGSLSAASFSGERNPRSLSAASFSGERNSESLRSEFLQREKL